MTTRSGSLDTAQRAFGHFSHGLKTGEWDAFLDMLTDDFTFYFPVGQFQGAHTGRERAREFFSYVHSVFPGGLTVMLDRVMSNDTTVVFEFRDEGEMRGAPYRNRVAVSFDVRGEQIAAYREYFGSDGTSY
jgi:ketosteroid isomerase-like protein